MNKRVAIIVMAALAALSVHAQGSEELAALQKQLNELSAKIVQLEKVNAEKTALAEQAVQVENANAVKIAQIEQDNAKKTWSIEQLQAEGKKDEASAWANDIKLAGDIRARYEKRDASKYNGASNDKDRERIRLRIGAYGKINEFSDFGVRLATGGTRTSGNQDLGDSGTPKSIYLDLAYVDLHPELLGGAHLFLGKIPQPWLTYNTGLIWSSDLNPEGAALTYEKEFAPFKLIANAGSFVFQDNLSDDLQLWSSQVAVEKKIGEGKLTLGVSDYYFSNAYITTTNLTAGPNANTSGTGFNLVEGFGSYAFAVRKLPITLNGQYVVNVDAANKNEDTAYLAGITVGKAKDKGTWEVGYSYRDIGGDAVVAGLNDSTFAGET
ncbi:MAG: putative porin, partial [Verrucomicrobia bacterium]|nr:putative porin [Verrucomicrobiota bacterium]